MLTYIFSSYLLSLFILCLLSVVAFSVAQYKKDNSVMDIFYGPLFLITALVMLGFDYALSPPVSIVLVAILIWSLRLGLRIYKKNRGKSEDSRYAAWRQEWMKRGRAYFMLRSFAQVNLFQCLIISVILLPFTIAYSQAKYYADENTTLSLVQFLGIAIFSFGLIYEAIADWQLDNFLSRKRSGIETATILTTGLFSLSRRPNYFGESLIWWGLFLVALPLPFGWLAIFSPLLITYIVTKITGPMLEKIFLEKYPKEYGEYMQKTSYFIPCFKNIV